MHPNKFKDKFKKKERDTKNYTATMDREVLKALDEIDGDRSNNIEKAVKSYFLIGQRGVSNDRRTTGES